MKLSIHQARSFNVSHCSCLDYSICYIYSIGDCNRCWSSRLWTHGVCRQWNVSQQVRNFILQEWNYEFTHYLLDPRRRERKIHYGWYWTRLMWVTNRQCRYCYSNDIITNTSCMSLCYGRIRLAWGPSSVLLTSLEWTESLPLLQCGEISIKNLVLFYFGLY